MIMIPKWMIVLSSYYKGLNSHEISMNKNIAYSQVHKISLEFENLGWIKRKIKGRRYVTEVIKDGLVIVKKINPLLKQLEGL